MRQLIMVLCNTAQVKQLCMQLAFTIFLHLYYSRELRIFDVTFFGQCLPPPPPLVILVCLSRFHDSWGSRASHIFRRACGPRFLLRAIVAFGFL
jgi:hypothetical protein